MGEYFFGIAGWSYPDWKGIVYPAESSGKFDPLSYIATFFDVVELNNTFYRIPESKIVEGWVRRVSHNPRFRFTAKLWQGFTHEKKPVAEAEVKQYLKAIEPVHRAGRLGVLLAQYPGSFKNNDETRDLLSDLATSFAGFPLVIEFRNRSWIVPETLDWLKEKGIGFCNVDEPVFRQNLKPSSYVTSPAAYVRFHGRNYQNWFQKEGNRDTRYDYLYSEEELDQWIPRIQEMAEKGKDVYVIGNNHFRGQAPANILQLKAKTIRGPVDVPDSMMEAYPNLVSISKPRRKSRRKQSSLDFDP